MINDGNKRRYAKSTYRTTDDYTPPASVKEPSGGLYGWICPVRDVCSNNQVLNSTLTEVVDWSLEGSGSATKDGVDFTPTADPIATHLMRDFKVMVTLLLMQIIRTNIAVLLG